MRTVKGPKQQQYRQHCQWHIHRSDSAADSVSGGVKSVLLDGGGETVKALERIQFLSPLGFEEEGAQCGVMSMHV